MTRFATALLATLLVGCPETPDDQQSADVGVSDTTTTSPDMAQPDGSTATPDMATTPDVTVNPPDMGNGERPAIRAVAAMCPMETDAGGTAWTGWGNLQYPPRLDVVVGAASEPVFGQTWQDGATNQPGMAAGWQAQLMVGPLGTNPVDQPGCFRALDAEFNADVDNNDEWWVRVRPDRAGLWAMVYRYRPSGGQWRYGDLNGSDDGATADQAGVLAVDDATGPSRLRVVTLNMRCRTDQWNVRMPLMVDALAAADPQIIGFQEDCSVPGGPSQSSEVLAALAERLDRGFESIRAVTHQADYPEGTFDEGISLWSALPIDAQNVLDLPFANFPRKAIVADVRLNATERLRAINTHFDNGGGNDAVRAEEAAALLAQVGAGPTVVTGDLNADPGDPAYVALEAQLDDLWSAVGVGAGLTIPSNAPARRIDYIWTKGLTPSSAAVVDGESGGIHLSDHVGVSGVFLR